MGEVIHLYNIVWLLWAVSIIIGLLLFKKTNKWLLWGYTILSIFLYIILFKEFGFF